MQEARRLIVCIQKDDEGRRVDRLLRHKLQLSAGAVRRAKRIEDGLLLDGQRVHSNDIVTAGQLLSVRVGDLPSSHPLTPQEGALDLVFEDEDLLIINKPAPLVVHPSPTQWQDTLANYLCHYYHRIGLIADFHPVNRLDRGTSGLMAVAKHAHAHERLASLLHTPSFHRSYLAICEGTLPMERGVFDGPIGRVPGQVLRREVRGDGAPARTQYQVLGTDGHRSLVQLTLESGRTHQIRVHLSHASCPLVGDFLYGEESPDLPNRFALHSSQLRLQQPISGQALAFVAPLPEELTALLSEEMKEGMLG